jgi:Putative zinc-finger
MNHETASGMKAAERYVLDELPPAERDAFEEHLSDCSRCMEDVWADELFRANARAVFQDRASGRPIPKPNGWLDWIRLRPVPVLAFSGALNLAMLALVGYGLHAIPALESRVSELDKPEVSQVLRLRGISRGAGQEFTVTGEFATLRIDLPHRYQRYAYILEDGAGHLRRSGPLTVPPDAQEVILTVPVAGLDTGDRRLKVTGSDSGQADEIAACLLHVQSNK